MRDLLQVEGHGRSAGSGQGGLTGILAGVLQRVAGHPAPQEIFGGGGAVKGSAAKTITGIRSRARFGPFRMTSSKMSFNES